MDRYYNNEYDLINEFDTRSRRKAVIEDPAMSPVERETTETTTQLKGTITELVKLREEPTLDARVIQVLDRGMTVKVLDTHREFYKVQVGGSGVTGYIVQRFCKVV